MTLVRWLFATRAPLLVLALACAGTEHEPARLGNPPAAQTAAPAASSVAAGSGQSTKALQAGPAASIPVTPITSAAHRGNNPIQALNQMLTAQALLVSLLLAPVSKDTAQAPLARLDEPTAP
jgi:hypothetical protein